jgi:hypothetical protein
MSRLVRRLVKTNYQLLNGDIFADATVGHFVTEGAEVVA